MSEGIIRSVILALVISVVLLAGIAIVDPLSDTVDTVEVENDSVGLGDAGETIELEEFGSAGDETVRNSLGNALVFTGADDSYLSADDEVGLNLSANWTISQGAWVDAGATGEEMTLLTLGNGDLHLRYAQDGATSVWQVWIYLPPDDTYVANVTATDVTNASVIQVRRSGDSLTIWENNSAGDTVDLSASNEAPVNLSAASNFDGRLDETRIYQSALDSSDRQALVDSTIEPVDPEPIARIMYDEMDGSTVAIYFASTDASASNVSLGSGFAGAIMDSSGLLSSGDYEWRTNTPALTVVEDARLDGHPNAWVSYDWDRSGGVVTGLANAISFASLLPILLIVGAIMTIVLALRK